jgi:hypothetical protein
MAFPLSADHYEVPEGSHVAAPGDGQVVYRRLAGAEPGVRDFRSDAVANKPAVEEEPWIEHAGLSVFDAPDIAAGVVARFPVFIAELAVPIGDLCSIAKTGPANHYTVWGDPRALLNGVTKIYRQNDASGTLEVHS